MKFILLTSACLPAQAVITQHITFQSWSEWDIVMGYCPQCFIKRNLMKTLFVDFQTTMA